MKKQHKHVLPAPTSQDRRFLAALAHVRISTASYQEQLNSADGMFIRLCIACIAITVANGSSRELLEETVKSGAKALQVPRSALNAEANFHLVMAEINSELSGKRRR